MWRLSLKSAIVLKLGRHARHAVLERSEITACFFVFSELRLMAIYIFVSIFTLYRPLGKATKPTSL